MEESDSEKRLREIERRQARLEIRIKALEDKESRLAAILGMARQMTDNAT